MQHPPDLLRRLSVDAWLVYDFRSSNAVFAAMLGKSGWTTRRAMLVLSASREPVLLVHAIDAPQFDAVGFERIVYRSCDEWENALRELTRGMTRVAMEYVPGGALPAVSCVDAGTVEFVRSLGVEVVSSMDLIQRTVAQWSPAARSAHDRAAEVTARIKDEAFALIGTKLGTITERDVQIFIDGRFRAEKLDPDHPAIVGVNAHSGDPHFEVSASDSSVIRAGDWVLIDLWAREPGQEHVFADITWVGYAGAQVPAEHQRVFDLVRRARDAAFELVRSRWEQGRDVTGAELDLAARAVLIDAGQERHIRHRTGHSLSPGPKIHGMGANLDGYETRDARRIVPGTGFTIEPGLYLPDFGCRLEVNVYVDPKSGPVLTSPVQERVVRIG